MHASIPAKRQQERITALEQEIVNLRKVLGPKEDADEIVSKHIKLLHQYNETKDATQILMGRLAGHRQTTIRQLYKEYELTDQD